MLIVGNCDLIIGFYYWPCAHLASHGVMWSLQRMLEIVTMVWKCNLSQLITAFSLICWWVLLLLTVLRERPPPWAISGTSDARVSASTTSLGRPRSRSPTQSHRVPQGGDSSTPIGTCVIWNHLCRWLLWLPPRPCLDGHQQQHGSWQGIEIPVKEPIDGWSQLNLGKSLRSCVTVSADTVAY